MNEHEPSAQRAATSGEPIYLVAARDGAAARRRGEPRDPAPYLPRYTGQPSLVPPEQAWLAAYDQTDALLVVGEAARAHGSHRGGGAAPAA
jgi:hypothetical protein